ncbi:BnaA04g06010D [Brassica napus]|uniref:BnaA04g06010D protein n=1 Tax=Brassica napus TaxID=3708 RepID=A0A078GEW0_BRANA|nr:BnaA04g06010D [Brassica napus]
MTDADQSLDSSSCRLVLVIL